MKNIIKVGMMAFAALIFATSSAVNADDVILTGVMDGTLTGGEPKVIEIFASEDIADLSLYALSRAGNGSTDFDTITADFIFPAIALSAGDYYFGVGNSFVDQTAVFDSVFPEFASDRSRNFGVNSNGDDVTGLFFDPTGQFAGGETLIDVFGVLGTDGTGEAWEHTDSWAYRNSGTAADGSFNIGDWTVAPRDSLDGLDAAGINAAVPFGTFSAVPEPGSLAVLAMIGLVGMTQRRRK